MQLKKLLKAIKIIDNKGILPVEIDAIYNDSRQVKPSGLFFAITGYQVDGHNYVKKAQSNGASVAIVEHFVEADIPQILVEDTRDAMAHMSSVFFGEPSKKLILTGITATNGKTSTAFMLDEIIKAAGVNRAILGTVKTEFKGFQHASVLTTPESLTLQSYFRQMVDNDVTHATMEVSSIGLELKRVEAADFDIVALNNISNEHTDLHGSHKQYVAEKSKLILQAKPDAFALLNLDDEYSKALIPKTKANVISYGYEDKSGDLFIENLNMTSGLPCFDVILNRDIHTQHGIFSKTKFNIKLGITGFYNVMNSLVAIGAAIAMGFDQSVIERGLASFHGVERRCQMIYQREYIIMDDHFANAGNIDVTMKTLSLMTYHRIILVYAIRGSRGVTTNSENAHKIVHWVKKLGINHVHATLSRGHVTSKDVVTQAEQHAFETILNDAEVMYTLDESLSESISKAINIAKKGDIVLLAGCQGMDCGGHVALNYIAKTRPGQNDSQLFAPIVNRICCESEVLDE